MKPKTILYISIIIGAGMLVGAVLLYINTSKFIREAARTEGTVVDFREEESSSDSDDSVSITYKPVVQFTHPNGQMIEFVSSVGSNPPSYSIGQKVDVLYRPAKPQNARISGFFSLWGPTLILGVIGGVFVLLCASLLRIMVPKPAVEKLKAE